MALKLRSPVTLAELLDLAEAKIRELVKSELPGKQKFDKVVDYLVEFLDEKIQYSGPIGMLLDSVDHYVFRFVLGLVVQHVYDELKQFGDLA